jgi:hypothetical protein
MKASHAPSLTTSMAGSSGAAENSVRSSVARRASVNSGSRSAFGFPCSAARRTSVRASVTCRPDKPTEPSSA